MKVKISIPTSLNEIKLNQYQKFVKIATDNEAGTFLNQKMVQIFCNVDLFVVAKMKQQDLNYAVTKISDLFKKIPELVTKFTLNGTEFGFIPNLNDMSSGEYMDLDGYITDWEDSHKSMAVLYRPIKQRLGNRYLIEDYEGSDKYAEQMLDAPMDVVLSSKVFFWTLGRELLKSTMDFLEQSKPMSLVNKHNLEKDGVGILAYMPYHRAMLEDLMKLPNYPLINA
ncbi:hypothetical protein UFOVP520_34 [uncultured Caudovirales phage]|jgi:hypothetical protein|uniref:Uncharacterized protein n=1 Tax=uncultured Caudovirales phage TaxID=2100421 RepID=A0A6J5MMF9_9CAUD|nr:hypothetical protein UFOVP520_34 [uncultured Caudovirales phage]